MVTDWRAHVRVFAVVVTICMHALFRATMKFPADKAGVGIVECCDWVIVSLVWLIPNPSRRFTRSAFVRSREPEP